MSPPSDMKKPLHRCNGEGAREAATKHHISDRSLPMDWFKISDAPGTDYTRVTVDVPHEQLADVFDAVRACAPAVERRPSSVAVGADRREVDVDAVRGRGLVHVPSTKRLYEYIAEVGGPLGDDLAVGEQLDDGAARDKGVHHGVRAGEDDPSGLAGGDALHEGLCEGDRDGDCLRDGVGGERGEQADAVGGNRDVHGGSSSRCGSGAGESAPAAGVGVGTPEPMSEGMGGEGTAVISVAFSVPRGGPGADMRWPAPQITALSLCDLIGETLADLQAALAEEAEAAEDGEGR